MAAKVEIVADPVEDHSFTSLQQSIFVDVVAHNRREYHELFIGNRNQAQLAATFDQQIVAIVCRNMGNAPRLPRFASFAS
jgi:hypothetical protein